MHIERMDGSRMAFNNPNRIAREQKPNSRTEKVHELNSEVLSTSNCETSIYINARLKLGQETDKRNY